jgi:hypothetical protein
VLVTAYLYAKSGEEEASEAERAHKDLMVKIKFLDVQIRSEIY